MFRRILAGVLLLLALAIPVPATITTSANSVTIAGNSVQTSFPFSFVGVSASDISVLFTSSTGVQTTVTQGPGSTQFQVTLNAASPGQLWGLGGTVTYNPGGTPIPAGSTLTIIRTVPDQQTVSLQNQASFGQLSQSTEQMGDLLAMQIQQSSNQTSRALVANIANSSAPNPLPPAAQAANQGLCFDGTGNNVIACSLAPSGVISSAMAPFVGSSTLSAAKTLLGYGSMASENINSGTCGGTTIQDDGSGNARVVFGTVADSTNQSVSCAFHGTQRAATGALLYTLPASSTLFNGFSFWINALNNAVTLAVNAADNFSGMGSGVSMILPPGTQAYISTNGAGLWYLNLASGVGLGTPLNLQLSCSVATNALTCSVLDRNGKNPSTASPVLLAFRDPTAANGDPVPRAITGALSITVPSSATLGTVSAQANRIWLADFDNAGTHVLGVYNSLNSSGPALLSWDETTPASGTGITSGSTSAQTWYTASGVTSKSFRILGYVESTQTTAGTWAASPSKVQLFGPGIKKPGDIIQGVYSATASATLVPRSAANVVKFAASGTVASISTSQTVTWSRGATGIASTGLAGTGVNAILSVSASIYDTPNTTSSTTYSIACSPTAFGSGLSLVEELQI
jgi:hypothetical protein